MKKLLIFALMGIVLIATSFEVYELIDNNISTHYRPTLEEILQHNPSLQQVLDHCQGDSLKYEAAKFLIENLPFYHSYSEKDMEAYLKVHEYYGVGTWYSVEQAKDSAVKQYGRSTAVTTNPISDLTISPDYLIENIEWAFKVRDEQPWSKNVSFDDFCEYILPHRMSTLRLVQ